MKKHVIALGRQFGSGGREIGRKLSESLGFAYYDRELLKLAAEKGMAQVTANIYAFNHQSQRMFLAVGFEKAGEEWYTYRLTPETEE